MKSKFLFVFIIIFLSQLFICNILIAGNNIPDKQNTKVLFPSEYQSLLSLKYFANSTEINSVAIPYDKNKQHKDEEVSEKSPWLAFGLSYLFPGLGQLYNGEYLKAILFPALFCIGAALIVASNPGADFDGQDPSPLLYIGIGLGAGSYLWNLIDAPVSANRINKENNLSGLKIFSSEDDKYVLNIKINPKLSNYGLGFTFNF